MKTEEKTQNTVESIWSADDEIQPTDSRHIDDEITKPEWDCSFNNIGIRCTDRLVQVINDEHLVDFLNQDGTGSMELAEVMRKMYQEKIGRGLQISQKSLAIELLGHVFFGEFVQKLENLPFSGKKDSRYQKFLESLRMRMDIIDCGERSIDNNRFIWDDLVPFSRIIFGISGKRA